MMNRRKDELAVAAVAILALLCCKSEASKDKGGEKPTVAAEPPKAPEPPAPAPTPVAPAPAATPAAAGDAYAPDGLPADIPAARSKVPTVAEWNAVPREISVARSTPLGCETKMVREWLRVSCRKDLAQPGYDKLPQSITDQTGKTADTYTMEKPGQLTSVVTPVLRGRTYRAKFHWETKTQTLVVDWPSGAPRPVIKFED
jgi:hypothetical protein